MRWIRCQEGINDEERIAVTGDALSIVERLKELDERYFIMLNRKTQKFEVHVRGQRCTLGCELPFDRLDARAIEYVRAHDSSRIEELVREMDAEDALRERVRAGKRAEAAERMADGLFYLKDKRVREKFPDEASEGFS